MIFLCIPWLCRDSEFVSISGWLYRISNVINWVNIIQHNPKICRDRDVTNRAVRTNKAVVSDYSTIYYLLAKW